MEISTPLVLKMGNLMNEDQFFQFCQINESVEFERDSQGNIVVLPLRSSLYSLLNLELSAQLWIWNEENQSGLIFSSSTGFTLPNGAVRSPDVSWIRNEKWDVLSREQQEVFAPICPDFVIEILSEANESEYLHHKMKEYISNGAQLGWLIDLLNDKVFVYCADKELITENSFDIILSGEEVLPGFQLNLGAVKNKIRI
jgi:Uma2 family endonuclease